MAALIDSFCSWLRGRAALASVFWFFVAIFAVSTLSIQVVLQPVGVVQVLALQTTLSADTFAALVAGLYQRGEVEPYLAHFYYDFLHPLWYGTLLALLLARAFDRQAVPASANRWLLLPYLAGLFDLVENSLHIYLVIDTANISPALVLLANGAALAKWTLVGACLVAVLVLFTRPGHNR